MQRKSWNLCLNVGTNVFRWVLNSAQRVAKTAGVTGFPCWLMNRGSNRHRVFFVSGATERLFNSAFSRRNLRSCMTYSFRLSSKEADISILRVLEYFVGIPFSGPIRIRYRFLRWLVGAAWKRASTVNPQASSSLSPDCSASVHINRNSTGVDGSWWNIRDNSSRLKGFRDAVPLIFVFRGLRIRRS